MIEVQDLSKQFGDTTAVDGVSFTAEPGALFGLLGPNGAGKSTTIACIAGLLRPSGGRIRILGHDVVSDGRQARTSLGVVPQELALYADLTARDNLSYWGTAYGLSGRNLRSRVAAVLELTGLADRAREPVRQFSGGMQRRLNFGCAIVHEPRVLLLDEPTVGVDPQSRVRLLDLIREIVSRGTCVLYTTHQMEEAESLCDRLGIMDHGRLLALGTLEELCDRLGERDVLRVTGHFPAESARAALRALDGAEVIHADDRSLMLAIEDAPRRLPTILRVLTETGAEIHETNLKRPTLESLFIKMTGRELRE